jgi:hypothetical protein
MMSDSGSAFETTPVEKFTGHFKKFQRQYQQTLDRWTPHVIGRWLSTGGLLALFFLRIVFAQGVSFILVKTLQNFIYLSCLVVHWFVFTFVLFYACFMTKYDAYE